MECTIHFVSVEQIRREGLLFARYRRKQIRKAKPSVRVKWFKRAFGITHLTAAHVYRDLQTTDVEDAKIKGSPKQLENFLMALFYMKKYPFNNDLEREFGYTEETCSEKVCKCISSPKDQQPNERISSLSSSFALPSSLFRDNGEKNTSTESREDPLGR